MAARHTYRTFRAGAAHGAGAEALEAAWRLEWNSGASRKRQLKLYLDAARLGQVDAMINAGSMLEHGDGADEAPDEARRWWRVAWRHSQDPVAAWNLGLSFQRIGNRSAAVKWFRHAARAGIVPAMERLAWLLGSGRRTAQRESVRWLVRLDALGELAPISTYNLALAFEFGRGTRKDLRRALRLYRRAALAGDADAQVALAFNLLRGLGARHSRRAAIAWYRRAAASGHVSAHFSLGQLLSGAHATRHLAFAAKRGHRKARTLLARSRS